MSRVVVRAIFSFGATLFLLFLCNSRVLAQGGASGAMSGTVLDLTGAVIPGAEVQIVDGRTGSLLRTLNTDPSGDFTATLLPPGAYTVVVNAKGFDKERTTDIEVRVTETTRVSISLQLGQLSQKVEVSALVAQVNTDNATTGQTITTQTLRNLPLATRNFQQLLATNAGASSSLNSAAQLGRGDVRINVNGGREDNNNYQIEGIGANDPTNAGQLAYTPLPSPDTIQEFKVSTSLYDATQGRNGGGNINAVLKSGSLDFHFDLFEYFRNTALNANDFFLKQQGLKRPVILQNIFGGSVGGPIGPKAKLGIFFVNYQGTRQQSGDSPGAIISTHVPYVPAADRGATAAATQTLLQSDSNCLAAGTPVDSMVAALLTIKSSQFGPPAGGYLFPLPTTAATNTRCGTYVPFAVSLPGKFDDDQFTVNWDRDFRGGKDHLAERFFFSDTETNEPFGADGFQLITGYTPTSNNLNFGLRIPVRARFGSLSETHIFTNSLVNEARFGVSDISWSFHNVQPMDLSTGKPVNVCDPIFVNASANSANTGCSGRSGAGIVRPSTIGVSTDIPRLFLSDSGLNFGPHPTTPLTNQPETLTFVDTLSYVRGAHIVRFGTAIDHTDIGKNIPIADNGFWLFGSAPNLLAGKLEIGTTGSGLSTHDYKSTDFAGFFQDDYKVTKSLTLNLGFRVEVDGAPYDALCHISNVDMPLSDPSNPNYTGEPFVYPKCATQLAANLGLTGITGTLERSGLNNNYATAIVPRIGIAYDVLGHQTTSIRAGYGIYTVREDTGALDNLALLPPFAPSLASFGTQNGGLLNLYNTTLNSANALPVVGQTGQAFVPVASKFTGFSTDGCVTRTTDSTQTPCFSGNIGGFASYQVPLHWIMPTTQQWNLSIERSIAKNWTLEVGYVGTKGTHLRVVAETAQPGLASPTNPIVIPGVNCDGTTGVGAQCRITQNTVANSDARTRYLGVNPANVENFAPIGNSDYNGLHTTVTHHFKDGLFLQSAYTFSKSIDDTSMSQVAFISRFNDQFNPQTSRGPSDFDRRHRWITIATYTLPFFADSHGFAHKALTNWEISAVFTLQSGTPFSVTDSLGGTAYPQPFGPVLVTASFAPGFNCSNAYTRGSIYSRLGGFLNPEAFVNPAPVPNSPDGATGLGNVPRNCFYGPHQINLDFSLAKVFRITERQSLRFTAEFFNLTNTVSFANPTPANNITNINSSPFAVITTTNGTPRLIQFALRYSY